jgi:hypothetical protein
MIARLVLLTLGIFATAGAHALTVTPLGSDAALLAALGGASEPALRFVGEGRIGNLATNGTFEYDVGPTTAAPASTGQLAWPNGENFVFSFDFRPATGAAVLSLGSSANLQAGQLALVGAPSNATYIVPTSARNVNAIYLRSFALNAPLSSILFEDLQLQTPGGGIVAIPGYTGTNVGPNVLTQLEIAGLSDVDLSQGFTLGGSVTLTWSTAVPPPQNSQLAFQFKVAEVPEPETVALLALGLAALAGAGMRRRR